MRDTGTGTGLRQGDVVSVLLDGVGATVGLTDDPCRVAIISQTCDVAQRSKPYCLVAPAEQIDSGYHRAVLKGRKPLLVPLDDDTGGRWVADVGRAFSVGKDALDSAQVVMRAATSDHGKQASRIRARIARAFGRFPFPDEVHPVFVALEDRLRSKAGTSGNLGRVIDLIDDVRVGADHWDSPGRSLTLYLLLPSTELISADDCDPAWTHERVRGWRDEDGDGLDIPLDRMCELILANRGQGTDGRGADLTTLSHLWGMFGQALLSALISPHLTHEVVRVDVEVLSDDDMTVRAYRGTEALDLQALSDAHRRT